jgi:hypothetical protein
MPVTGRLTTFAASYWHRFGSPLLGFAMTFALVLPAEGAVRRRLNVRSNPPGALVYVDNQQIGTTPCSVDFVYYGTREIRLIKPGFETLTVNQPIPTPWYEFPGLDFISENLLATKIRDNRTVTYNLSPQLIVPTPELLDRANQLRQDTLRNPLAPGAVVAPPASVPAGAAAPVPTVVVPPSSSPEPLPGIPPATINQPSPPPFAPPPGGAPLIAPRP